MSVFDLAIHGGLQEVVHDLSHRRHRRLINPGGNDGTGEEAALGEEVKRSDGSGRGRYSLRLSGEWKSVAVVRGLCCSGFPDCGDTGAR